MLKIRNNDRSTWFKMQKNSHDAKLTNIDFLKIEAHCVFVMKYDR